MKFKFISTYIVCLIIFNTSTYAFVRDNFTILDSLIFKASAKIIKAINSNSFDTISIKHNNNQVIPLFINNLLNNSNLIFMFESKPSIPELNLQVFKANVYYENFSQNDDSLNRKIELYLSAFIKTKENKIIKINIPKAIYSDVISRKDIDFIENNSNFEFVKGKIPERKTTFFEEVTEPLIIITGALVVIVLLFTVRSS